MCKTYDAIYNLSNHVESDILICNSGCLKIEGKLHKCNCEFNKDKCYNGIITLEDAVVFNSYSEEIKEYKWINISSKQIQTFAFKCCEK